MSEQIALSRRHDGGCRRVGIKELIARRCLAAVMADFEDEWPTSERKLPFGGFTFSVAAIAVRPLESGRIAKAKTRQRSKGRGRQRSRIDPARKGLTASHSVRDLKCYLAE